MPSEISQRIRAKFANSAVPTTPDPLEVSRKAWEDDAQKATLPPDTQIKALTYNSVLCEEVSCSVKNADHRLIFLHGGGFNSGSCVTHRELAARLSLAAGIPVLNVDYRLAPEHPFPAAVEDVVAVYRGLLAADFMPNQLAIGGDSAGGGLALKSLLVLRDSGEPMPAALVTFSAWADLSLSGDTMQSRAAVDPLVKREDLQTAVNYYIGTTDPRTPHISPVYADLHHFPPMMLHSGDHEVLLDDSRRIAQKAIEANVEAQIVVWPEMWHVFPAWAAELPEGQQAIDQTGTFLREKLRL